MDDAHGNKKTKYLIVILLSLFAVGFVMYIFRRPVLAGVGDYLIVSDRIRPADVIHVLGGGFDRLDYGVELYKKGYGKELFITGGDDAVVYRAYVASKNIPPSVIKPEISWAINTREEALELKQHLDARDDIKTVTIVTAPYQMRRARYIFTKILGNDVSLLFAPVPFVSARYKKKWWRDPDTRWFVFKEYVKIPYYYVRYGLLR